MNPGARNFRQSGLTLLELLVAMLLAAVLLLGLVQLVTVAGSATLLQDNQVTLRATGLTVELAVPDGFEVAEAPDGAQVEDGNVRWVTGGAADRVFDVVLAPTSS